MATAISLYKLDDAILHSEYVKALYETLKTFLLQKGQGHCQRLDFLPRPVMEGLGKSLSEDQELKNQKIVCRVVTDKSETPEPWEVSGSGAVKLREDSTYDIIKVFCALFPSGLRLAEEDSLNVATFKTDDEESFDAANCLERHLIGMVNLLPSQEAEILKAILYHVDIRRRPVQNRVRFILAILGQKEQSQQSVTWETAGAYLYEMDLVPDFGLNQDIYSVQLARNSLCMEILTEGEKSLGQNLHRLIVEAELADEERHKELMAYLADKNLLRTKTWLPPICHEESIRANLSFDEWKFAQPISGVRIELKPLQDPKKPEKVASGLTLKGGELTSDGKKPIRISWKVSPPQAPDLGRYLVTVVRQTQDQGEMDVIPPQYVPAKRKSFSVSISDNNLDDDEKCVATIRIQCLSKSGMPIQDANDESEQFWIEKGEDFEDQPTERGQRIRHLDELPFNVMYQTGKEYGIRSQGWDLKRDYVYAVRLTNNRRGDLILNPVLRDLERKILENPNTLGIYDANLVNQRSAKADDFKPVGLSSAVNQLTDAFYQAREKFFISVRDKADGRGVIEVVDLHELEEEVIEYIDKYLELMEALKERVESAQGMSAINTLLHDYSLLNRIDTMLMRVGPSESPMKVLLLAPTHPLRVLWLFQYQTLVRGWIGRMKGLNPTEIKQCIEEDVLDKLTSLNIPSAISPKKSEAYVNTDNFGLFWGFYPNSESPDLRTAVNAAMQVLGAGTANGIISTVTPRQIADKMERYLCHHPYVQTMKLNVVNPGDGGLILEAVKLLLAKDLYKNLNFDIKFFAPRGTRHQLIGNALDEFILQKSSEDWTFGRKLSETEELLLSPNENPLFPKLIYAKHAIEELLDDQEGRFESHLTFVIDFFGTTVSTREHTGSRGSSFLNNLLTEYVTDYNAGATTATWSRMIAPNSCADLASDGNTARLFQGQDFAAHFSACFFDWSNSLNKYITVQLELTDEHGKNHLRMLDKVHQASDWVFTIDRNFGIEFYDDPIKGPGAGNSGYLIDYSPEFLDAVAHRLVISTFHQHEIESILRAGFIDLLVDDPDSVGEVIDTAKVAYVLQMLKSVSGKLALKLINNPSQAQEVIGLALTRLSLEREGRLSGRVLIPVDSHIELFYQTPKELENSELSLKRTDLMLVKLNDRRIEVDLIEVKNRKASSPAQIYQLQEEIRDKNKSTEQHFRHHYLGGGNARFDATIKNKEWANILLFYFERAHRYGLFMMDLTEEQQTDLITGFMKGLEAAAAGSCEVQFRHEGYIFNGASWGQIDEKEVHGNIIKIFGRGAISSLLDVPIDEDNGFDEPDEPNGGTEEPSPSAPVPESVEKSEKVSRPESPEGEETPGEEVTGTTDQPPEEQPQVSPVPEPLPDEVIQPVEDTPPTKASSRQKAEQIPEKHDEIKVYLGVDTTSRKEAYWDPKTTKPKRLLNQHLLIVGKSGAGKSETTKSMLFELNRQEVPSIILDFQGEYASEDFHESVKPQIFDVMDGLPINPFEIPVDPRTGKKRRPVEMMFRLADTLNSVFSGSGDIQLGKLREAIKECYVHAGFEMNQPAPDDRNPPTLEMLSEILDRWSKETGGQIRNLQVRLQPLFESGIFEQGRAQYSFEDIFTKTTVILLTAGIKDLMLAASRFLLEKIYSSMLIQGMSKDLRVMVCIDEAHKLCNDPKITDLVKEARKYGMGLILSSQETRDFHPSIFANAGTQIVLALEEADAGVIAKQFTTNKKEQKSVKDIIMCQESGIALIKSMHFQPYSQIKIKSFEDRKPNM